MGVKHLSAALRRLNLVQMESYHLLVYWSRKLKRARKGIEKIQKRITEFEQAHPHWVNPDADQTAIDIMVIALMPIASVMDALFISPVADYSARTFFPQQPVFTTLTRIFAPIFMVSIEAILGVIIHNAKETPHWDGSRREFQIFSVIGYAMVLVTPLLVMATFFAATSQGEESFPLLAFVFALFAAVLHLAILKSGRWVRQAFGWLTFIIKRSIFGFIEEVVLRKFDRAEESILIAYPAYDTSTAQLIRFSPNDSSVMKCLPEDVDEAVRSLFKPKEDQQLSLSFDNEPPVPRDTDNSETAFHEDEEEQT